MSCVTPTSLSVLYERFTKCTRSQNLASSPFCRDRNLTMSCVYSIGHESRVAANRIKIIASGVIIRANSLDQFERLSLKASTKKGDRVSLGVTWLDCMFEVCSKNNIFSDISSKFGHFGFLYFKTTGSVVGVSAIGINLIWVTGDNFVITLSSMTAKFKASISWITSRGSVEPPSKPPLSGRCILGIHYQRADQYSCFYPQLNLYSELDFSHYHWYSPCTT